jgi:DNA-binding response OmpR family regulator
VIVDNGPELLHFLRGQLEDEGLGVETAPDAVSELLEALDTGAADFLTKPFSIEELLAQRH